MGIEDSAVIKGDPVKQFSLMLENRIGAMHSMIKLLNDIINLLNTRVEHY